MEFGARLDGSGSLERIVLRILRRIAPAFQTVYRSGATHADDSVQSMHWVTTEGDGLFKCIRTE
jgi:hypothetical protein